MSGISNSDTFIDPAAVALEAGDYETDIDDKKEKIQELKENLEDEEAADKQVDLKTQIDILELELRELETCAESILSLHSDCEFYASGAQLINKSYFTKYCEEFAYDLGEISRDSLMSNYIDWGKYAEDCKMDYTIITFEDTDFYVQG